MTAPTISVRVLTNDGDLWVFDFQPSHDLPRGDTHGVYLSRGEGPGGRTHFAEWGCSGLLMLGRAAEGRPLSEAMIQATYLRGLRHNIDQIVVEPEVSVLFSAETSVRFDDPTRAAKPLEAILWEVEHLAMMIPMFIESLRLKALRGGSEEYLWDIPTQWNTHGPLQTVEREVVEFYEAYAASTPMVMEKREIPRVIAQLQKAESLALRAIRSIGPKPWSELRISKLR